MKEKLQQLIAQYKSRMADIEASTYYNDFEYYRTEGEKNCLEEVVDELTSLLEEAAK